MYRLFYILVAFCFLSGCSGQNQKAKEISRTDEPSVVGGGCEGCELMYVDMPEDITHSHQSPGWKTNKQKLWIEGTVLQLDGQTPAENVVLYYWHTNDEGLYESKQTQNNSASQHGSLRGWVKTGKDGKYIIKTSRPAPYPGEKIPAHIHLSVKEPDLENEYYMDWYFDDDPLYLVHKKRYGKADRGGTEILRVLVDKNLQRAERNIILGLNIPNYPKKNSTGSISSGLSIGEDQPSFIPYHAFGPDKGTRTCPVCKYGRYHGIVYFAGSNSDWAEIESWLAFLEREGEKRNQYLKVYFVYANEDHFKSGISKQKLEYIGEKLNLKRTALTYVPSFFDEESEANLNKINPDVGNTFIVYKHRTIIQKAINLTYNPENKNWLTEVLDKSNTSDFHLKEIHDH